ncbi:hypothetical protein Angca_006288 [Angiostrongylus cantonensis]|nr:hypothetical protein Angca_006288 [Angiostrongylus cantonensis]
MFDSALEFVIKYTNCTALTGESTAHITNFSYSDGAVQCHLSFRISGNYTGNVKFYYGLREFYQNNKLYVHSRNDVQLLGNLNEVTGCRPLDRASNFVYAPCGFVANSMFNGELVVFQWKLNRVEKQRKKFLNSKRDYHSHRRPIADSADGVKR